MEEIEEPRMTSSFFFFFLSTENGRMELPLPLNEIKKAAGGTGFGTRTGVQFWIC